MQGAVCGASKAVAGEVGIVLAGLAGNSGDNSLMATSKPLRCALRWVVLLGMVDEVTADDCVQQ